MIFDRRIHVDEKNRNELKNTIFLRRKQNIVKSKFENEQNDVDDFFNQFKKIIEFTLFFVQLQKIDDHYNLEMLKIETMFRNFCHFSKFEFLSRFFQLHNKISSMMTKTMLNQKNKNSKSIMQR